MTIRSSVRNIYITSDGREFLDEKEAKEHEFGIKLDEALDELGICQGGDWSPAMVYRAMYNYKYNLRAVFNLLNEEEQ